MSRLMILGAGGHGKVVAEVAELMKKWDEIVFIDDNKELSEVNGHKIIGDLKDYKIHKEQYEYAFVAIGNNKLRIKLINNLLEEGFKIPALIHPFTFISSTVQVELGTVVMAGAVINANARIDKGCIVNTSSSIDHDCVIEEGVHISPGVHIGGTTYVGKNSWVCIGVSVANNMSIGKNVIVASGGTVIRNIEDNVLFGGVPGKVIKEMK